MPIHRHQEEPLSKAVIADLTCDSDGKISRFIDQKDVKDYLLCHKFKDDQPYFLATFLVGAYQEILGDLHNLFGDTNAVHVNVLEDGQVELTEVVKGDTVREVLEYVEYDYSDLKKPIPRFSREGDYRRNDHSARLGAATTTVSRSIRWLHVSS